MVVLFDFAGSLYTSAQQQCMCLCRRYLDSDTFTVLRYCFEAKRCFFFGGGGGGGGGGRTKYNDRSLQGWIAV